MAKVSLCKQFPRMACSWASSLWTHPRLLTSCFCSYSAHRAIAESAWTNSVVSCSSASPLVWQGSPCLQTPPRNTLRASSARGGLTRVPWGLAKKQVPSQAPCTFYYPLPINNHSQDFLETHDVDEEKGENTELGAWAAFFQGKVSFWIYFIVSASLGIWHRKPNVWKRGSNIDTLAFGQLPRDRRAVGSRWPAGVLCS